LVEGLPTSKASIRRKFMRDLSGITGLKRIYGHLLMDFGYLEYTVASRTNKIPKDQYSVKDRWLLGIWNTLPTVITNTILALGTYLIFKNLLGYVLFLAAYLTTFSIFI